MAPDAADIPSSGLDGEGVGCTTDILCAEGEGRCTGGDNNNKQDTEGAMVLQDQPGGVQLHAGEAEAGPGVRAVVVGLRTSDQLEADKEVEKSDKVPAKRARSESDEQLHPAVLIKEQEESGHGHFFSAYVDQILKKKQQAFAMLKEVKKKETEVKKREAAAKKKGEAKKEVEPGEIVD